MQVRGGSVLTGAGFASADIVIKGERFAAVDPQGTAATAADGQVLDASGCYVVPGLIDLHFHGCVGHDFCDGTEEAIDAIARHEASCGVTAICPATMTYPEDVLAPIMDAAASYEAKRDGAALVGINMEGPYISPGNIGAQNPAYLHLPDEAMFRRLQERSGNLIKLVDVAPEVDGALDFIRSVSSDVRVSIAHTQADYDTACAAIEAGARQMTHLCNAMPPLHHRKPGPIGAAFDHSEVMPELIADGVHIHPAVVRAMRLTVDAAHRHGCEVGICGEFAGCAAHAELLVGLGFDELSVAPPSVPAVKERIRGLETPQAELTARRAVEAATASEVHELIGVG